jgi:hypothetical protein
MENAAAVAAVHRARIVLVEMKGQRKTKNNFN